jgi:hypothetical protein
MLDRQATNVYIRTIRMFSFRYIFTFTLLTYGLSAMGQSPEASSAVTFAPADSEFVMEIKRVKTDVIISITFKDSLEFNYVSIERQANFSQTFTQCKYISFAEAKNNGRHIVIDDEYPYAASIDVSYRVKLNTKDGAMRTYPPILLPAVSK